jgi:hypothetical protein
MICAAEPVRTEDILDWTILPEKNARHISGDSLAAKRLIQGRIRCGPVAPGWPRSRTSTARRGEHFRRYVWMA